MGLFVFEQFKQEFIQEKESTPLEKLEKFLNYVIETAENLRINVNLIEESAITLHESCNVRPGGSYDMEDGNTVIIGKVVREYNKKHWESYPTDNVDEADVDVELEDGVAVEHYYHFQSWDGRTKNETNIYTNNEELKKLIEEYIEEITEIKEINIINKTEYEFK